MHDRIRFSGCCLLLAGAALGTAHAQVDGSFDTSFGSGGALVFDGDNKNASATTLIEQLALAPNGDYVVTGLAANANSAGNYWWLGRITPNAQFVASFGANDASGRITECQMGFQCATAADNLFGSTLQTDGKVVILSHTLQRTAVDAHTLDSTASGGGSVGTSFVINSVGGTVDISDPSAAPGLVRQIAGGKLLVAGVGKYKPSSAYTSFGVVRLNTDLTLDTTFNPTLDGNNVTFAGGQYVDGPQNVEIHAIAVQSDGKILIVGANSSNATAYVTRLNADGSPDTGYGTNGIGHASYFNAVSNMFTAPLRVKVDRADRLLITAATFTNPFSNMLLGRFAASGAFDTSFATNGWSAQAHSDVCADIDARDLALDSAGRILVAGTCSFGDGTKSFAVQRLRGDTGALDPSFGFNGFSHGTYAGTIATGNTLLLDAGGRVVVAGEDGNSAGIGRLTYDLIFTTNFDTAPRGCLPPNCN